MNISAWRREWWSVWSAAMRIMEAPAWHLGWGGITAGRAVAALGSILAGFALARLCEVTCTKLAKRAPDKTLRQGALRALGQPLGWLFRIFGIWAALTMLPLEMEAFDLRRFIHQVMLATTVALATWLGTRVVQELADIWMDIALRTEGKFDDQLVPIVRKSSKVTLVVIGAVMVIQNLGYSVASLLAGLGLGGAALAFASKDTVANFFGSIVIFVDRPFQVGDWIEVGSVEGTVEEVGLRVTRIRTFANSLISMPNASFTTEPINNWSRMKKRRIKMTIGVTYDTRPQQLQAAVDAIRAIIRSDPRLHQDFFLVNFFDFGASSLDIFCYLFTVTTQWAEHMQVRQEFMLKVMEALQGLGLSFAFPTRTVHLEGWGQGTPPGAPDAMSRDTPL